MNEKEVAAVESQAQARQKLEMLRRHRRGEFPYQRTQLIFIRIGRRREAVRHQRLQPADLGPISDA